MAQDTEAVVEATDGVTAPEDLTHPNETLAPEIEGQETPLKPGEENPEGKAPEFNGDEEQVIEFGGKTYTLKGKELQTLLENQAAFAEKEKSLNRDYTQKTQALARERKSIESAFGGRMPQSEEFQALGKVYQAYMQDENVAKVIDAVLSGEPLQSVLSGQPAQGKGSQSPEVTALQSEIRALKGQLSQFVSTSEQKEQEAAYTEGKRIFDSWMKAKNDSGVKVPDEVIDSVLETASILRRRNPDWDTNKALDEALRRETIDQIEKSTTSKILEKADKAKKMPSIKITPKSSQKADASMGYKEIFQSAM